ncbi:site-specific integrase [Flagellimonas taeanensis]|uniref:site-specific integrase n=1 Tax=Flagellimonas taeanensis TaxID=1005926 RepID=UPI000E68BF56|nr:site-specific integrase [Allomuricauda taeanensis]RIV51624.1 site-specific integrase [Allomuricauda taeanensis]
MRNSNTLKVLLFTRDISSNPQKLTIYARITVNGKRAEISLKRYVSVNEWDENKGRLHGLTHKARLLNSYLDEVYAAIMDTHKVLLREEKVITAQAIKARYLGQDEQHSTLHELIEYHNKTQKSVLRPGTMKNYYGTKKYLFRFLESKYKLPDIRLKQLNYKFITDFEHYLLNGPQLQKGKKCTNNGAMKHLERLMKMVKLGVKLEWLDKDPFINYKLRFHKTERSYLTERELRRIEETDFTGLGYEKVKDAFLFACYTGLSYIDVRELEKNQLVLGIDGNQWIYTKREKTSESVKLPLLPKAKEIIEKYWDSPETDTKVIPVLSNQKTNKYLKEIAKACGIYKTISFHSARHTFATTVTLSNGVPIETVSKMLGHTKLSTTQIYARVLEHKIGEDMQNLIEHMQTKKAAEG